MICWKEFLLSKSSSIFSSCTTTRYKVTLCCGTPVSRRCHKFQIHHVLHFFVKDITAGHTLKSSLSKHNLFANYCILFYFMFYRASTPFPNWICNLQQQIYLNKEGLLMKIFVESQNVNECINKKFSDNTGWPVFL